MVVNRGVEPGLGRGKPCKFRVERRCEVVFCLGRRVEPWAEVVFCLGRGVELACLHGLGERGRGVELAREVKNSLGGRVELAGETKNRFGRGVELAGLYGLGERCRGVELAGEVKNGLGRAVELLRVCVFGLGEGVEPHCVRFGGPGSSVERLPGLVGERRLVDVDEFKGFAAPVAEGEDLAVGAGALGEEVIGGEFDFAAAAGQVDDEVGDAHAADAAAQEIHDFEAGGDGRAEVGDALGHVALEDVVGAAAVLEEFSV